MSDGMCFPIDAVVTDFNVVVEAAIAELPWHSRGLPSATQELAQPPRQHVSDAAWAVAGQDLDRSGAAHITHEKFAVDFARLGLMLVTVAEWDARGQVADSEGSIIARLRAQLEGSRKAHQNRIKGALVLRQKLEAAEAEIDRLRRLLNANDELKRKAKPLYRWGPPI